MRAALILATQQFAEHPAYADDGIQEFFFIESAPRFAKLPYHPHKIVLLVSAMRHTAARLEAEGKTVRRITLEDDLTFKAGLEKLLTRHRVTELTWMSDPNRPSTNASRGICADYDVETDVLSDGLFLTPEEDVDGWFAEHPTPLMEDFYHWQRRRTGILMDGGKPAGRRWNFDADNRKALPKKASRSAPAAARARRDHARRDRRGRRALPRAPGSAADFWLPVTPRGLARLARRVRRRAAARLRALRGRDEADEPFLFHAIISPMLNIGLLTVDEVRGRGHAHRSAPGIRRGIHPPGDRLARVHARHVPRASEAGARQRPAPGQAHPEVLVLGGADAERPALPVRTVLERCTAGAMAHHIERLMVLGNWFLLQGYAPRQVNDWFPRAVRRRVRLGHGAHTSWE